MAQNSNLFTFNPYVGVVPGIFLVTGMQDPYNSQKTFPPHMRCGDGFIATNRTWESPIMRKGRLMSASLMRLTPGGKKPFWVFDAPNVTIKKVYAFIDPIMPEGMKSKIDTTFLNCWTGVTVYGDAEVVMKDFMTGTAFVEFAKVGDKADIFLRDGRVFRLCYQDSIVVESLAPEDMADLRVEQFRQQIALLNTKIEKDMRHFHGVLAGAIRLLRLSAKTPSVRGIFRDFLENYSGQMTIRLRAEVREILLGVGDVFAGNFVEGIDAVNVVDIRSGGDTAAKQRAQLARKRGRSAEHMNKGVSGGGKRVAGGRH